MQRNFFFNPENHGDHAVITKYLVINQNPNFCHRLVHKLKYHIILEKEKNTIEFMFWIFQEKITSKRGLAEL